MQITVSFGVKEYHLSNNKINSLENMRMVGCRCLKILKCKWKNSFDHLRKKVSELNFYLLLRYWCPILYSISHSSVYFWWTLVVDFSNMKFIYNKWLSKWKKKLFTLHTCFWHITSETWSDTGGISQSKEDRKIKCENTNGPTILSWFYSFPEVCL